MSKPPSKSLLYQILSGINRFLFGPPSAPSLKRSRPVRGRRSPYTRDNTRQDKPVQRSAKPASIKSGKPQSDTRRRVATENQARRPVSSPDKRGLAKGRQTFSGNKSKNIVNKRAEGRLVGEITHYFPKIQVAVVKTTHSAFRVGDKINVQGLNTDFCQTVGSLQVESVEVKIASKGKLVGLKVLKAVTAGDKIFRI